MFEHNSILLLISNPENCHLLSEFLTTSYQIKILNQGHQLEEPFDLCIVDGLSLNNYQQQLKQRIASEKPVFLPILLLTPRQQVKRVTGDLWKIIDDLLITPVEKVELLARVETLLRSRNLSLELKQTQQDLCLSQEKVRELQDELEQLNKLFI